MRHHMLQIAYLNYTTSITVIQILIHIIRHSKVIGLELFLLPEKNYV